MMAVFKIIQNSGARKTHTFLPQFSVLFLGLLEGDDQNQGRKKFKSHKVGDFNKMGQVKKGQEVSQHSEVQPSHKINGS